MAGFILKNTLSENGAVTRGICETNESGYLTAVHETHNIVKTAEGAAVEHQEGLTPVDPESYVSMNMWGLTPGVCTASGRWIQGIFPEYLQREHSEGRVSASHLY